MNPQAPTSKAPTSKHPTGQTRRIICLYLPHLPIERLSRLKNAPDNTDNTPFALTITSPKGIQIFATNNAAHEAGLKPAMRLNDARAICHQLQVRQHQPKADAAELLRIAHWLERYSPSLQLYGPDSILIDSTGCSHLFGGENKMLANMHQRLNQIGYTIRFGLADTIGAAFALAHHGEKTITIIAPDKLHQGLAFLPVKALRLSPEQTGSLYTLGLKTIGQLFDIPRASLKRRFAGLKDQASVLKRLDQALGVHREPLQPQRQTPILQIPLNPAEPCLHHEGIAAIFDTLLERLLTSLERQQQGLRKLRFQYFYSDGGSGSLSARFAKPSKVQKHIKNLFTDQLLTIDPRFGIDGFVLSADATDKIHSRQINFLSNDCIPNDKMSELIDRLINRLGKMAVFQVEGYESHLPERSDIKIPPLQHASIKTNENLKPHRPITLFNQPETIQVIAQIPEGPPMQFRWRRVLRQTAKARGPERISPQWWSDPFNQHQIRDYYEVEDTCGQRYWLFRSGLYDHNLKDRPPSWHIHGLFL